MAAAFGIPVDWDKYKELVQGIDILTYDPPQKKVSFFWCRNLNIFTPRSPWCKWPWPCCWTELLQCYVRHCRKADLQHVKITQADDWFLGLMEPPAGGDYCPDFLRGVWWMQDNIADETLMSFESGYWGKPDGKNTGVGVKHVFNNWTFGSGYYGSLLLALHVNWAIIQISPDGKWICLGPDDWIYILDENDKLVDPSGKPYPFTPGEDLLRVTWPHGDPKQGIYYQYLLRRVAKKDPDGNLVKLPAYDDLLDRATRPTVEGCCCNLFLCNIPDDQYGTAYDSLDDHQLLVPGPERNPPWDPRKEDPANVGPQE